MGKQSTHRLRMTRRVAALRLRQMIDEFRLLTSAFPDLRDAFDPDELPIQFILRRDSQSERAAMRNPAEPAVAPMTRTPRARSAEHRGIRKKPASAD